MTNISEQFFLPAVLDRLEGDQAVIVIDSGQTLVWPAASLPEGAAAGSCLRLTLQTDQLAQQERTELAKAILKEILQADDQI